MRRLLPLLALLAACAPAERSFFVEGGALVDVEAGALVDNPGLLVEDGVITALGAAPPAGVALVEAEGLTLVPGLWDSHAHIVEQDDQGSFGVVSLAWEMHRGARYKLDAFLDHGVTALRDPGGAVDSVRLRDRLNRGEIEGPRMLSGGLMFTAPDGYPGPLIEPQLVRSRSVIEVDSPEAARAAVRRTAAEERPDFIKVIYTTGPLREDELDPEAPGSSDVDEELFETFPILDFDVLTAIVDEARAVGLEAHCHADRFEEARDLVDAGCKNLHHAWPVPEGPEGDAFFAALVDEDICWNVTLVSTFSRSQALYAPRLETVRRAVAAGVRITAGTDTGSDGAAIDYGVAALVELGLLEDAGMSPLASLRAATLDSAACAGVGERTGSLVVGKAADLILVDGDLAASTNAIQPDTIHGVFVDGRRLR